VSLTLRNTVTPGNICRPIMYKVPVGALIFVTHMCSFSYKTRPTIRHLPTTWRPRNLQAVPHSIRPRSFPEPHPTFPRNIPLCVFLPLPLPADTKRSSGRCRSSLSDRNCASTPTCLSAPPTFPPSLDWDGHRQRKLLLCEHACVRSRQWRRTLRLRLGRPPRRHR
jgi:hypothetical protein